MTSQTPPVNEDRLEPEILKAFLNAPTGCAQVISPLKNEVQFLIKLYNGRFYRKVPVTGNKEGVVNVWHHLETDRVPPPVRVVLTEMRDGNMPDQYIFEPED